MEAENNQAGTFIESEHDNIIISIKEEPPLEIEDYLHNSGLESSENSNSAKTLQSKSVKPKERGPGKEPSLMMRRCIQCQYETSNLGTMWIHFQKKHPTLKPSEYIDYRCKHCKEYFKTRDDYKKHLNTHRYRPHLQCPVCLKQFTKGSTTKKHVARFHPGQTVNTNSNLANQGASKDLEPIMSSRESSSQDKLAGASFSKSTEPPENEMMNKEEDVFCNSDLEASKDSNSTSYRNELKDKPKTQANR